MPYMGKYPRQRVGFLESIAGKQNIYVLSAGHGLYAKKEGHPNNPHEEEQDH